MLFGRQERHARLSRIAKLVGRFCAGLGLVAFLGAVTAGSAIAQPRGAGDPGLATLAASERPLRIGIIGDSLATDLWFGVSRVLRDNKRIEVVRFARAATGLVRDDVYDWYEALRGFLSKTRLDVVAVMIGGNDRQSVYVDGRRLERFSPDWMNYYAQRVSRFMNIVAASGADVHWIGLPPVRSAQMTRDYARLNEVYRAQAAKHGFSYVSVWETFAGADGNFSSFGRTVGGERRRLRMRDGLHFSTEGQTRLGHVVAGAIGRAMAAAR